MCVCVYAAFCVLAPLRRVNKYSVCSSVFTMHEIRYTIVDVRIRCDDKHTDSYGRYYGFTLGPRYTDVRSQSHARGQVDPPQSPQPNMVTPFSYTAFSFCTASHTATQPHSHTATVHTATTQSHRTSPAQPRRFSTTPLRGHTVSRGDFIVAQ